MRRNAGRLAERQRLQAAYGTYVDALASRPRELIDRGSHALKGKSAEEQVFGLDPQTHMS
jgi:hypothetical protein